VSLKFKRGAVAALLVAVATLCVGVAAAIADDDNLQPIDFTHNVSDAPAPVTSAVFGQGGNGTQGVPFCSTAPVSTVSGGANVNTDCDLNQPHNETSIAVNPTNPDNIIGGANDYQLGLNPGGHVSETILSRAHVSTDGGKSWSEFPLFSNNAYQATGDPSVAFDASGHAYYATLGFRFVGPASAQNPDVLVSDSGDGGRTWSVSRIAQGSGNFGSVGASLDKEYVAAWGAGNAIVTWGDFTQAQKGAVTGARIFSSVTHDFGKTWSSPTLISTLDQAFVSVPTVAADGSIYVAFMDTKFLDPSTPDFGRDVYEVVKVSPATGAPLTQPIDVAKVIDGVYDYPQALGRQVYQDSLFRTWAAGNITADPKNARHLAVVFSDMRNSQSFFPHVQTTPYGVTTNSDVVVSESFDGGATWSSPHALALSGDQFMPWGAFDQTGQLRIGYFDRSVDPANHLYGYSLATEPAAAPGATTPSNAFTSVLVSNVLSDPTKNNRWFAATLDPAFPFATSFIGDYSNIAIIPNASGTSTSVAAYWTDLRDPATFAGATRQGENAYFARVG
jgi:hypothetical protein